jgi:hypothetical protein
MDGTIESESAVYEVSELRQQIEKLLDKKGSSRAGTPDISRKRSAPSDDGGRYLNILPGKFFNLIIHSGAETETEDSVIRRAIEESTMSSVVECLNDSASTNSAASARNIGI